MLGGFAWSGFNLCVINFIFDSVSPAKRTRCFSYFNVINGFFICMGALIGGYLAAHAPKLLGYQLLSLFIFSSITRFLTVGILSPKIKEVRLNVEVIKSPGYLRGYYGNNGYPELLFRGIGGRFKISARPPPGYNPRRVPQLMLFWIYQKQAGSFEAMTNLSLDLRSRLKEKFVFRPLELEKLQESADGTKKFLFALEREWESH